MVRPVPVWSGVSRKRTVISRRPSRRQTRRLGNPPRDQLRPASRARHRGAAVARRSPRDTVIRHDGSGAAAAAGRAEEEAVEEGSAAAFLCRPGQARGACSRVVGVLAGSLYWQRGAMSAGSIQAAFGERVPAEQAQRDLHPSRPENFRSHRFQPGSGPGRRSRRSPSVSCCMKKSPTIRRASSISARRSGATETVPPGARRPPDLRCAPTSRCRTAASP